eukprot:gb/GEZN01004669.1/.p1 GENE.gb/GEZN01004669.1/~~gb/GEZN01004669.1/.p1  ORF type:complete len:481 (+),score=57.53 gb/GEZN01004669.1/:152-1444(+)
MTPGKRRSVILAPAKPAPAPVTVDSFEPIKVIGVGGFCKVLLVKKKDTGMHYALKVLEKKTMLERKQVFHVQTEWMMLSCLRHPFMTQLYWAFQDGHRLYFVMDFCQGGELFRYLQQAGRFTEDRAMLLCAELALVMGYLHENGFMYRDLKPENLMYDKDGHLKLVDFGLAKELEGLRELIASHERTTGLVETERIEERKGPIHQRKTSIARPRTQTFAGTPEYLAPEIISKAGHNHMVDWWGLGILLFELVVGIPPFYSQDVGTMFGNISAATLRFPAFMSNDCKDLIGQLLNRDQRKRLGANGLEEVKAHPFWKKLDWDLVASKAYIPEVIPQIDSPQDVSNFDNQFTSQSLDFGLSFSLSADDNSKFDWLVPVHTCVEMFRHVLDVFDSTGNPPALTKEIIGLVADYAFPVHSGLLKLHMGVASEER